MRKDCDQLLGSRASAARYRFCRRRLRQLSTMRHHANPATHGREKLQIAFAEELRRGRSRTQDAAALAANFEWNADVGANAQFNTNTAQLLSIAIDSTGPPRCSS